MSCRHGARESHSDACVLLVLGFLPFNDASSWLPTRTIMPTLIHCNFHNNVYKYNNIVIQVHILY